MLILKAWAQRPGWWVHRPCALQPLVRAIAVTSVRCLASNVNSVFLNLYFPYLYFLFLCLCSLFWAVIRFIAYSAFAVVPRCGKKQWRRWAPLALPLTVGQKVQTTTNCSSPRAFYLDFCAPAFPHLFVCILWLPH